MTGVAIKSNMSPDANLNSRSVGVCCLGSIGEPPLVFEPRLPDLPPKGLLIPDAIVQNVRVVFDR